MTLSLHREQSGRRVIYRLSNEAAVWSRWDGTVVAIILCIGFYYHLWLSAGAVLSAYLYIKSRHVLSETLLIIPAVGIQIEKERGLSNNGYLGRLTTREEVTFLTASSIVDIFINEGFSKWKVVYYLAVLVNGQSRMTIVFRELLPPVRTLEPVWQELRGTFFAPCDENELQKISDD